MISYQIRPISAKTGKFLKRPKKNQLVYLQLVGPRGGSKLLSKFAQPYLKSDFDRLNEQVQNTKGGNFIVYEQKTNYKISAQDVRQRRALKKDIDKYKLKLTGPQPQRKQRPLLYVGGKSRRAIDIGYKKGHKKNKRERQPQIIAKSGTPWRVAPTIRMLLHGRTIKEAVSQLQIDTLVRRVKGKILYYTLKLKVYEPRSGGGFYPPVDVPASGSFIPTRDLYSGKLIVNGRLEDGARNRITMMANMQSQIAKTIRYAMADEGYQFTSLSTLQNIQRKEQKRLNALEKTGYDDFKLDRAWQAMEGITKVGRIDMRKNNLVKLNSNWKVELYINFEIVG